MITNPVNLLLAGVLFFCAIVFLGLSIPLIKRKIKMNHIYGMRFKKSFTSNEAWYDINEYGGKFLAFSSIPLFILGLMSLFIDLEVNTSLTLIIAFSPAVIAGICAWYLWRYTSSYPEIPGS